MLGKITTPTGESVFTKINTPDNSFGKEVYTATLKLDAEQYKEFRMLLLPSLTKAAKSLARDGLKVTAKTLKTPVKELEDGSAMIYTKVPTKGVKRATGEEFENKVTVLNSEGEELTDVPMIGKGSKMKISADVVPYAFEGKTGVTFRLKQVMLVDLVKVESLDSKTTSSNVPF